MPSKRNIPRHSVDGKYVSNEDRYICNTPCTFKKRHWEPEQGDYSILTVPKGTTGVPRFFTLLRPAYTEVDAEDDI